MKDHSRGIEELKVSAKNVHFPKDPASPSVDDCLLLDLSSALHFSRDKHPVVSWSAQVEAEAYINKHGLAASLEWMAELRAKSLVRDDGTDVAKSTRED